MPHLKGQLQLLTVNGQSIEPLKQTSGLTVVILSGGNKAQAEQITDSSAQWQQRMSHN